MAPEKRHARILASALDGAVVRPSKRDDGIDLLVRPRGADWIPIQVKWAGEGWPEDVRRAAEQVPKTWPPNLILLAQHLSPGAIQWLRERGANWADETGQARILGPGGLLVIREPAVKDIERHVPRAFHWSPSAISIAETILARADEPLRVAPLAQLSGCSVPQVSTILQAFDAEGWTAKRGPARGPGAHRELIDADGLLASWSAAVGNRSRKTRIAHRATRDVMTLLRVELKPVLDRHLAWAVTGWAGLELAAPFTTIVPALQIYVDELAFAGPLSSVIDEAKLTEVPEGGRITFWSADDRVLGLASARDDVPTASAPRLYADLSSISARGQDAADHVKRVLIDPRHSRSHGGAEDPSQRASRT
jgi:hypothetical protein